MTEPQANAPEQKLNHTLDLFDLEVGNYILALDRLYGAKRAEKMALQFKEKEMYPVPSCAALEIIKHKGNRSILLNALDEDNVIWCIVKGDSVAPYRCVNCPIFETFCEMCPAKIRFDLNTTPSLKYGCKKVVWRIFSGDIIVYQTIIYMIVCPECEAKLNPVAST